MSKLEEGDTGENSVCIIMSIFIDCFTLYFHRMLHLLTQYHHGAKGKILKLNWKLIVVNVLTIYLNKPKFFHILWRANNRKEAQNQRQVDPRRNQRNQWSKYFIYLRLLLFFFTALENFKITGLHLNIRETLFLGFYWTI